MCDSLVGYVWLIGWSHVNHWLEKCSSFVRVLWLIGFMRLCGLLVRRDWSLVRDLWLVGWRRCCSSVRDVWLMGWQWYGSLAGDVLLIGDPVGHWLKMRFLLFWSRQMDRWSSCALLENLVEKIVVSINSNWCGSWRIYCAVFQWLTIKYPFLSVCFLVWKKYITYRSWNFKQVFWNQIPVQYIPNWVALTIGRMHC
jgi:hypothetical protein